MVVSLEQPLKAMMIIQLTILSKKGKEIYRIKNQRKQDINCNQ